MKAATVICQQIFSILALVIFLLKILLGSASKSSFFSLWRRDPVLELQFPTPLGVVGPRLIDGRGVLVVFKSFCRGFYNIFCRCRRASGPFFNLVFLLFRFFFVLVNFLSGISHALDATL